MTNDAPNQEETWSDRLLAFTIPSRDARGRAVRLDNVLEDVLAAHDYPPAIRNLLAEALVLTALMGGLIKGDRSQVTLQAQTKAGPVRLLVCDYRQGAIRGYADFEADAVDEIGANASLAALFGEGHLAITFDLEQGGRYQGIVPLEGDSLAAATQDYFARSEQVPTLIRVAVTGDSRTMRAGGLLVQHMADGEEGRERLHVRMDHPNWEHIAVMGGSVRHAELLDEELSLDAILWRLFHEEEEVRIAPGPPLSRGCRCTVEHYQDVLGRFSEEDRKDMRGDDGLISVDCAFCSKVFAIAA